MSTLRRSVTLFKAKTDLLTNDKVVSELKTVFERVITPTRKVRGWKVTLDSKTVEPTDVDGTSGYMVKVNLICNPTRSRSPEAVANEVAQMAEQAGKTGGKTGWQVAKIDDRTLDFVTTSPVTTGQPTVYCDFVKPDNWRDNFVHVFERDPQIEIIMSSIDAGMKSDWEDRLHCGLIGPPAAGKSELLRCLRATFGEEAVAEFDATATSQMGAIRDLQKRVKMPRLLLIEEIEKTPEDSLRWLLGVLDLRAEIRKTNYRENFNKEVKMLCFATVNNFKLFKSMMSGALASRFVNKIFCPSPGRALLERILTRDVSRLKDGNTAWIKPTLDFTEQYKITDPRTALAIMKCGRDDLLTGVHQKRLEATSIVNFDE